MALVSLFGCYLQELCYWFAEECRELCPEIFSCLEVSWAETGAPGKHIITHANRRGQQRVNHPHGELRSWYGEEDDSQSFPLLPPLLMTLRFSISRTGRQLPFSVSWNSGAHSFQREKLVNVLSPFLQGPAWQQWKNRVFSNNQDSRRWIFLHRKATIPAVPEQMKKSGR